jgi:putative ABC transport system substrate-binding protein
MRLCLRRREFIGGIGSAVAWPLAARAQQRPMPVIGFLGIETPNVFADRVRAFRQGLSEMGYVEGRNVAIAFQWAGGHYDLLPTLADEFVRQRVSVLVAVGTGQAAAAAKAATPTIPIVFYTGRDPVAAGLVTSLNRPGGNLTGVTGLGAELRSKRLELLHEAVPAATSLGFLVNPAVPLASDVGMKFKDAARTRRLDLHFLEAASEREFDEVFLKVRQLRAVGLVIEANPYFLSRGEQLGALSIRHRVPAILVNRDFVAGGGLMSYGSNLYDNLRLVGLYTGRILKGEKPADLPVQQSTKVELFLNLKTAKALGITVPPTLYALANEVIE